MGQQIYPLLLFPSLLLLEKELIQIHPFSIFKVIHLHLLQVQHNLDRVLEVIWSIH